MYLNGSSLHEDFEYVILILIHENIDISVFGTRSYVKQNYRAPYTAGNKSLLILLTMAKLTMSLHVVLVSSSLNFASSLNKEKVICCLRLMSKAVRIPTIVPTAEFSCTLGLSVANVN